MAEPISPSPIQSPTVVATCHGIDVLEAPHLGPGMIDALKAGKYERREFEASCAVIHPGARILELGAGSGFVGAAIARNCAPERIVAFEANPNLIPHIRDLYAHNGLSHVIEVRHQVLMSEPDHPDTVTFHVRGNFLGSGLTVVKNPHKAVPVTVDVASYSKFKAEFPHDVIVMDIEGAEQAFFEHADLSGVRTIIYETHRDIYGRDGMKACRKALDRKGFAIDAENSRGGVHVWTRNREVGEVPTVKVPEPVRPITLPIERTFSGRIDHLQDAVVVPERDGQPALACGVLKSDGSFADLSRGWIRAFKATAEPTVPDSEAIDHLSGSHLFAGHLRGHFGHFLVESTARLWALAEQDIAPDSVLYLPYRGKPGAANKVRNALRPFFDALRIDVPINVVERPTLVDNLVLPELGFGWRARFAGSPKYQLFMRDRLCAISEPDGSADLYVSRSLLNPEKGGVVGERVIEENLARLGYEVFHPQKHDLETQIARYRAARRIVALDGSALHLAGFVADPSVRVGIILRRSKANHADYTLQYESFLGVTPDIINAVREDWADAANPKSNFRSVGELDFESVFRNLASRGYISRDAALDLPDEAQARRMIRDLAERRAEGLVAIPRTPD